MNGRSAQKVRMRGKRLVETIVPSLDDIVRHPVDETAHRVDDNDSLST